jgi:serine/threonine-protein kinase
MPPPSRNNVDDEGRPPGAEVLHGRYRLAAKLGSGGMADVYLADDLRLGRQVAVKVLRADLAADDAFVERFRTEARAVAMLNHPNVVALYDRGHVDGRWYLVMEYVRGETLKQRLRREGALSPDDAVAIARALLAALQAAHERHIVHRDVTAQNVLLATDGRVKVADFGIARIGASALTRTGTMIGTCHYLSPEQARGLRADERSDLYSAGVVLFEMLTGRLPFEGDSDVAVALQHVNDAPPRPRDLAPALSEALERVVSRALDKDPDRRYQTAAEFALALSAALAAPDLSVTLPAAAVAPAAAPVAPAATPVAPPAAAATALATPGPGPTTVMPDAAVTTVRPRRRRRWPLAVVLTAVAAVAAGALLYVFVIAAGAVIPDVVGASEAQARAAIRGAGLRVVTHREYVDGVEAGAVARQRPGAGLDADERSRVHIWVSRGPVHLPAPDVRGLGAADAHDRLAEAGVDPSRRTGRSDDVGEGGVYRQEPAAGETLARGDTVTYWVSTGLPRVPVPDVVGLSSGDAADELEAAGFTISVDVTFGWGEYPDTVVAQDPSAGVKAERGAEITISVAVF